MKPSMYYVAPGVCVPAYAPYVACVREIVENETFQTLKHYPQHGSTSCLDHSIAVSWRSYVICKKRGLNASAAARGGLLHDLFLYDWHRHRVQTGKWWHGFSHPNVALKNAEKLFKLTAMEKDIISSHMWPLTLVPPMYRESVVVVVQDKICSLRETVGRPYF